MRSCGGVVTCGLAVVRFLLQAAELPIYVLAIALIVHTEQEILRTRTKHGRPSDCTEFVTLAPSLWWATGLLIQCLANHAAISSRL